ncbi:citrate synthase [Ehrlichia ruminantium]|uniref:Citrate synthase n=1 Tax=Ehrlichia ruminantium TaxID=779 RepID=A0AAE6UI70_EHRRU|nr:citrate synthase [Ehrlichia ruminantium]QGR02164.1 citrate synthase [Ehrlichia ruminantium]QGR03085.1 citrate synthase [Ehrlichia ruminantium]QGR04010.1 citrate synthase [Ehrlichia ruminantium]
MVKKAAIELDDQKINLPILYDTEGNGVLDITSLYKNTGVLTYDPGFMSTAACESKITFIDGNKGILRYRGYDIADLVNSNKSFTEIVYLLFYGTFPNTDELQKFISHISQEYMPPQIVRDVIVSFPQHSHPMAILIACFSALAAHYCDQETSYELECKLAVAKVASMIALIYRHITNQDFIQADSKLSYSKNFVHMMFDISSYEFTEVVAKALDIIFILHADHEQNASTATVRMTGSSGPNLFACLASGAATLWGPAHGGANEAVINMLMNIGAPKNVKQFIQKVKDSSKSTKLMGFGHRVYKNYDPRARIMCTICKEILQDFGVNDPLLEIAVELENIALQDEYFIERNLYPNVDFYSGIVLKTIGIPVRMFTTLFALARTSGWSAQWYEMVSSQYKISRPRQLYTGNSAK